MLRGELTQWNDERGFGFITGDDGQRYFVHISEIGRINTRPRSGDQVTFSAGRGKDGRLQAQSVRIAGANPRATREVLKRGAAPKAATLDWRFPIAIGLGALLAVGFFLGRFSWELPTIYAVMSLVSLINYRLDKHFAETGQWRTSEAMLLTIDLCCGIIGGLLAQALFRHKTRKESYVATTLVLVLVHALWLGGLAFGFIRVDQLAQLAAGIF